MPEDEFTLKINVISSFKNKYRIKLNHINNYHKLCSLFVKGIKWHLKTVLN